MAPPAPVALAAPLTLCSEFTGFSPFYRTTWCGFSFLGGTLSNISEADFSLPNVFVGFFFSFLFFIQLIRGSFIFIGP